MKSLFKLLIFLLFFIIGISEGDLSIVIALSLLYLTGYVFCYIALKNKKVIFYVYDMFFFVYVLLAFVTEIELIGNPYVDYFVHYDASHHFFAPFMETAKNIKWQNIIRDTFFEYQYGDRPLTAFISVVMIKIGSIIGVEDFRLFLRASVSLHAAIIPAVISSILSIYGYKSKEIIKLVVPFGLFSYLFITSGIFTRDTHICLFYTLAAYLLLLPKCRLRWLWFLIVLLCTVGHRFENGIIIILYILGYFYTTYKKRYGTFIVYISLMFIIAILAYELNDAVLVVEDTLSRYEARTQDNVGGLFQRFYSLPFPFNTLAMVVYVLLMPLPITKFILEDGGSWFTLPFVLSPYLMALVFVVTVWYATKNLKRMNKEVVLILITIISFIAITFGSPDLRRSFASVPGLYMAYCLVLNKTPQKLLKNVKYVVWPLILVINLTFLIYTMK